MKKLFYFTAFISFSILQAQDLKEYIPYDASLVGSINGNNILKSVTIDELDNSPLKKLLDKISEKKDRPINSFDDFGIDTASNIYLYHAHTDSLSYTTFLFPLKSNSFLETLDTNVTDKGMYKMHKIDESNYMAWDDKKLVLIMGSYNHTYFEEYDFSEIEAELALEKEKNAEDEAEGVIVDVISEDMLTTNNVVEEMGYYEVPYFSNYTLQEYAYGFYSFGEQLKVAATENNSSELTILKSQVEHFTGVAKEIDSIDEYDMGALHNFLNNKKFYLNEAVESFTDSKDKEMAKELIEEAVLAGHEFNVVKIEDTYRYKDYYDEKKALEDKWTASMANTVMKPAKKSILSNKKYLDQVDSNAAANIWNPHIGNTLSGLYSGIYSVLKVDMDSNNMFMGYGELTSNLYFEETQARIDFNVTLSDKLAKSYKRILDKKINKKFFNYINEDEFLGYMTYNINVKNTLEEYPKFVAETTSPFLGDKTEEMELGAELFSLLLDEEAVSKVIKGDAMVVLSGISEKEVTYIDYEYDDAYNYTEVEKTKMEKAPDFLLMISTEDTKFINNLMNYLVKKGEVQKENGYYKIADSNREFPLGLFFTIKDGIFFLNTSEAGMKAIINNTVRGNLSSKHKKIINSGNYAVYFNGEKIVKNVPLDELDSNGFNFANYFMNNAADFYIKSSKLKNNKITSEVILETPAGHKNALTYMLNLIGNIEK